MTVSPKQFAAALMEVLAETPAQDHACVVDNFANLLNEYGTLSLWPEIEGELNELQLNEQGKISVHLTVAREGVSDTQIFERLEPVLGKNVVLTKELSKEIIGGFIVETKEMRIDASIKNQLANLKIFLSV